MDRQMWTAENLAKFFHETFEALAPAFNYETREQTRVPWSEVPDNNKALMVSVAGQVIDAMQADGLFDRGPQVLVNVDDREILHQIAKDIVSAIGQPAWSPRTSDG